MEYAGGSGGIWLNVGAVSVRRRVSGAVRCVSYCLVGLRRPAGVLEGRAGAVVVVGRSARRATGLEVAVGPSGSEFIGRM